MKLYKYINSDKNVKEIRVHVNEIAGSVTINGYIANEKDRDRSIKIRP